VPDMGVPYRRDCPVARGTLAGGAVSDSVVSVGEARYTPGQMARVRMFARSEVTL